MTAYEKGDGTMLEVETEGRAGKTTRIFVRESDDEGYTIIGLSLTDAEWLVRQLTAAMQEVVAELSSDTPFTPPGAP